MSELLEHIPKYIKIKENIRREIEEGLLKDGQKLASESVLIERFKVSKMTIIHALQELVEEGYLRREQGKGTFVTYSGRRPCLIAVLLTPIDLRPLSIFVEGIEAAASRLGCELAYFIMREDKTSSLALADRLAILKTTGAIVYPVGDSTNLENYRRWFHKLMKYEIPMVILDFKSHESVGASLIQTNNEKAMAELTRKVIEQGHRRLLLIRTDKRIHLNAAARINGFLQAVYQNIEDVECFHILSYNENESMETKRRTVQAFLDEFRPTAIMGLNDHIAIDLMRILKSLPDSIHEKVSLTGFDDLPFVDMIGLTTVHQPFREEGEKAVEIVHDMIQKGKRPSSVTIPSIVVVRESLKPPMQTNGWFGN